MKIIYLYLFVHFDESGAFYSIIMYSIVVPKIIRKRFSKKCSPIFYHPYKFNYYYWDCIVLYLFWFTKENVYYMNYQLPPRCCSFKRNTNDSSLDAHTRLKWNLLWAILGWLFYLLWFLLRNCLHVAFIWHCWSGWYGIFLYNFVSCSMITEIGITKKISCLFLNKTLYLFTMGILS